MPVWPLRLLKPRCPHFLQTFCDGLISACQVKNSCHIPLFFYLIQSCHYLLLFSINSSLSPSHALHLIRKCFKSSTSPLSHFVHFLSSLLKPLHLPTSTCGISEQKKSSTRATCRASLSRTASLFCRVQTRNETYGNYVVAPIGGRANIGLNWFQPAVYT